MMYTRRRHTHHQLVQPSITLILISISLYIPTSHSQSQHDYNRSIPYSYSCSENITGIGYLLDDACRQELVIGYAASSGSWSGSGRDGYQLFGLNASHKYARKRGTTTRMKMMGVDRVTYGGRIYQDSSISTPSCNCGHEILPSNCSRPATVVGSSLMAVVGVGFITYYYHRKSQTIVDKNIEAFITQYGFSTPKRYRYSEIKRMVNSFKDELGRGGFGSVFKGTLVDGSLVAIKLLQESKGNGEEFINEVVSIGRTSHVNIVSLLGFCYEGRKRALVYEFMHNGSLEKFIYHTIPKDSEQHLTVKKLYEIALGIARGLEYLHRGCNTRILHFDIKPHNILLDKDFRPKISDFGLAKLHLGKESFVSMVEVRGTIGYIAPEVFNRNFGGVSHKSDVYSYGMMVLEMIGGRKNIDVGVVHSSEIYFPQWIYKQLEQDKDLCLHRGPMTLVENEIARKMTIVGLWCIQVDPSQRPSINKVIEMLELGSLETLKFPPNPFFVSPLDQELPATSSTTMESVSLQ